jgi:hypothetical protein
MVEAAARSSLAEDRETGLVLPLAISRTEPIKLHRTARTAGRPHPGEATARPRRVLDTLFCLDAKPLQLVNGTWD